MVYDYLNIISRYDLVLKSKQQTEGIPTFTEISERYVGLSVESVTLSEKNTIY